jgi:hypothetical protein
LGVEPTASTARVSRARGIETREEFFGVELAARLRAERGAADLIVGNNVLAHVPDINDFVAGIAGLLAAEGVATLEFPHLLKLVAGLQFDTVYHEHYSYLSLHSVQRIFASQGLRIFDVEHLPTHGGSIRIFACHDGSDRFAITDNLKTALAQEASAGMLGDDFYGDFQSRAEAVKDALLDFLLAQRRLGKRVAGYGAAAKGNTMLNFAGVRRDLLGFVSDAAPSKQGKLLPGSHIPILSPDALRQWQPHFVLILPWNIREEIVDAMSDVRSWGGRFVTAIPELRID